MGKKLDALLGRSFKTSKFKAITNLAISRLAVLKNQRHARCSHARSDVVQLLNIGHHERALLRVEHVIKEQNMLDVFAIIEGYCLLLIERVTLLEQDKLCPDELKEAVSSLIYAATRCGEFPELQEIRSVFTSRFGKEFAARAIELRNNCGVNPKMIQKLSTRMPSLENRLKVLKEIASDNNIVLQIEEDFSESAKFKDDGDVKISEHVPTSTAKAETFDGGFSDIGGGKKKYRDVADAAQAAFESAAHAAAAARAAVELSRSESTDPDDPNSPNPRPRKVFSTSNEFVKPKHRNEEKEDLMTAKDLNVGRTHEKVDRIEDGFSESGNRKMHMDEEGCEVRKKGPELKRVADFDGSDENSKVSIISSHGLGPDLNPTTEDNEVLGAKNYNTIKDENSPEEKTTGHCHTSFNQLPTEPWSNPLCPGNKKLLCPDDEEFILHGHGAEHLKAGSIPVSVRRRRGNLWG